jgi:hypothetical protein
MSGGTFNHQDWNIGDIADQIDEMIYTNERLDGYGYCRGYSPKTLLVFRAASDLLKCARVMVHRIDWLVAGDDGEDNFHERLIDDLDKLCKELQSDQT